jgi:predicted aconitase with swiveling domain
MKGRTVAPGLARGKVLTTSHPISFCLGVDPTTGLIIDSRHELCGQSIVNKILMFPFGKGSSGAGLVILELIRSGLAPAAIINLRTELVVATGSIVAIHFYQRTVPMMCLDEVDFFSLKNGQMAEVDADSGRVTILD